MDNYIIRDIMKIYCKNCCKITKYNINKIKNQRCEYCKTDIDNQMQMLFFVFNCISGLISLLIMVNIERLYDGICFWNRMAFDCFVYISLYIIIRMINFFVGIKIYNYIMLRC